MNRPFFQVIVYATSAPVCTSRLLLWLLVLAAFSCTKEANTASDTTTDSAPGARLHVPIPSQVTASAQSDAMVQGAPKQNSPDGFNPPDASAVGPYPVELFSPFTKRFSSYAVDLFAGEKFRVRVAPDPNWREVSSCEALLALPITNEQDTELEPSTELDIQSFWSTAVDCLALRLVQAAQPAQRSRLAPLLMGKDPSHLLPPGLSMVDFTDDREAADEAAAQCRSWKEFDKHLRITRKSPGRFGIRSGFWSGDLSLYARGDLDGDGDEDVLVRRNGGAEGGSYAGSALFLLSQRAGDRCIRIVRELGRS